MATFPQFLNSLDADPQIRGDQFEKVFVKWFLKNDPEWSTQVEQVWLFDNWPGRWGRDKGTDLIFKHKNGEIWAVQAKCYNPDYYIKKADIDSFLADSDRPEIHKRLLIATTDLIGPNAKDTLNGPGSH